MVVQPVDPHQLPASNVKQFLTGFKYSNFLFDFSLPESLAGGSRIWESEFIREEVSAVTALDDYLTLGIPIISVTMFALLLLAVISLVVRIIDSRKLEK